MSGVEPLARVLRAITSAHLQGTRPSSWWQRQARAILANPGPLLEALAEAGVLQRHISSRPGCRDCSMYRTGHIHRRYVTEWEPADNAEKEMQT